MTRDTSYFGAGLLTGFCAGVMAGVVLAAWILAG